MEQSVDMGTIHAGDFLRRFCSNLGMKNQAMKAAQEAVKKSISEVQYQLQQLLFILAPNFQMKRNHFEVGSVLWSFGGMQCMFEFYKSNRGRLSYSTRIK